MITGTAQIPHNNFTIHMLVVCDHDLELDDNNIRGQRIHGGFCTQNTFLEHIVDIVGHMYVV